MTLLLIFVTPYMVDSRDEPDVKSGHVWPIVVVFSFLICLFVFVIGVFFVFLTETI